MYKSPIDLIYIYDHLVTEQENDVFKVVVRCGIDVDKDELVKALAYDRGQYEKGYADGKIAANAELNRCKDCKYSKPINSEWLECQHDKRVMKPHGFCSWAELKEDEDANN